MMYYFCLCFQCYVGHPDLHVMPHSFPTRRSSALEPIGHGIAFRYRTTDGLLAIEYNPFLLSPSRVFDYIYEFEPQAEFDVTPRMREDVWEEFNQRPLRKMVVGIAGNPDVAGVDDPDAAT